MIKVSVVIPVKNGGKILKKVLTSVLSQKTDFNFEVVVIDSGSSDGSLEFLKSIRDDRLKILTIKPQDFGHGKTRNFAVENSQGEYIAFITQDALPYNDLWLANLVGGFHDDPEIVGVFGKHMPYDDCLPVEKKQIVDHFDVGFGTKWLKFKIEDKEDYKARQGWYIFYSDNNSCMRRSAWEKIPYRDVWMSEDQFWAKDILEAGMAKAYAPDAVVYHSHRYSFSKIIKRYHDEYSFHVQSGNTKIATYKDTFRFFLSSYKYSLKIIKNLDQNIANKVYWVLFYLVYDLARSYGYYLGTNSKDGIKSKYSMQNEIIKS